MLARVPRLAIRAALTAVSLVLAHNLIFLLTYGADAGAALARTGHDATWSDAATTVLTLGSALFAAATWRLWRLTCRVRSLEQHGGRPVPVNGAVAAREIARFWTVIAPASAALLVLQENLEHAAAGLPLPLLGVLYSAEYPVTVPVVVCVALGIAAVAGLFALRIAALEARAARLARPRFGTPPAPRRVASSEHLPVASILGRRLAGRAPPVLA